MTASESSVRRERIDTQLEAAGWRVVPYRPRRPLRQTDRLAIAECPTDEGPADYALTLDGRIVGIVEAKRLTLGPQNALTQAERYARGVPDSPFDFRGFRVPFLFSTNGEVLWFHDVRHPLNVSRQVAHFPTPDALAELLVRDFDRALVQLAALANLNPRLRPYQREANDAIEAAIASRKRQLLVAMATGTGKTFTLVNEVYRLLRSGVARRILFLVDRRALAAQAVRAFASFEPEPNRKFDQVYEVYSQRLQRDDADDASFNPKNLPEDYLIAPRPGLAFVYVCTIQRMAINLFGRDAAIALGLDEAIDDDAQRVPIPGHAFDLIVADECHRGYTTAELSVWRNTLDHFDAIKLGLTATPAAHTKAYFKDVVYRYEYERAVREGYLVDYNAVAIKSDVRLNGVFLPAGEQVENVDPESGVSQLDFLEDERQFDTTDVERRVTAPDSNRKILEEIRKYALEHEAGYGRFPKTLIFAVNDLPHTSHADQLVNLARDVFGRGDGFVHKITGRVDRPLQRIREFRNRPEPGIVVTVDLLSTGVDIPDLEFIVFLRPVKSRILFEQMLGRGTRLGEKFSDKSHFVVFDCFDGSLLAYFRQATALTAEPPERETRPIGALIEAIWQNRDRDYNVRCLVKRLQRIDKEMSGDARAEFARFIPNGDVARFAAGLPRQVRDDFTATLTLLRNPDFQHVLENYPRPKRSFVVAYATEDTVDSQWLIRDGQGREHRPEDYLTAFARFVKENPAHVEAIQILLNRPRDWSTDALGELRAKLQAAPEGFTVERLQRAHDARYHKALVDLISMVKHAANEGQPLLTAEERVRRAVGQLREGRSFTYEQLAWLERIEGVLVANLSLGKDDFDSLPILYNAGGWRRADRAFAGGLAGLVQEINEAIAA
jgi:type I restriction enzyme R subunit